jgi:hypothetical protein
VRSDSWPVNVSSWDQPTLEKSYQGESVHM